MHEHPIPSVLDGVDGNPIIDTAETALRAFGVDLDRGAAARLLKFWGHYRELSERESAAVLDRFPTADPGWVSGTCGQSVPHGADRWAAPGEVCFCGLPARVIYETAGYGDIGYCGRSNG